MSKRKTVLFLLSVLLAGWAVYSCSMDELEAPAFEEAVSARVKRVLILRRTPRICQCRVLTRSREASLRGVTTSS